MRSTTALRFGGVLDAPDTIGALYIWSVASLLASTEFATALMPYPCFLSRGTVILQSRYVIPFSIKMLATCSLLSSEALV